MRLSTKIGVASVGAAGAYFFFYNKKGIKQRKALSSLAVRFQKDVMVKLAAIKQLDPKTFNAIIDETAASYAKVKAVTARELKVVTADLKKVLFMELKKAWHQIGRELHVEGR